MTDKQKQFLGLKEVSLPWPWIVTILISIGLMLATIKANSVLADTAYNKACKNELTLTSISAKVDVIYRTVLKEFGE